MKTLHLTLGEKDIAVPFPFSVASAWRQKIKGPLGDVMAQVKEVQGIKIDDLESLIPALQQMAPYIIDLPDQVAHLVVESSPELDKSILDEASDEELMDAFVVLLKAAFPFGQIAEFLRTLPGAAPTTSKN